MGADQGPDFRGPSLADVQRDFQMLKQGEGLTAEKMREVRHVMAAIGESHPTLATQRLLDDLADQEGDDGLALRWALRVEPGSKKSAGLDARRTKSGVAENTAKDREKRAVRTLYGRWTAPRAEWASAVHASVFEALPARAMTRLGSLEAWFSIWFDADRKAPVVEVATPNRASASDFVTIAARPDQLMVVYGTSDLGWRLQVVVAPFEYEQVFVYRRHVDAVPECVVVEQTGSDGIARSETIPSQLVQESVLMKLEVAELAQPCPITWWWQEPPTESPVFIGDR